MPYSVNLLSYFPPPDIIEWVIHWVIVVKAHWHIHARLKQETNSVSAHNEWKQPFAGQLCKAIHLLYPGNIVTIYGVSFYFCSSFQFLIHVALRYNTPPACRKSNGGGKKTNKLKIAFLSNKKSASPHFRRTWRPMFLTQGQLFDYFWLPWGITV